MPPKISDSELEPFFHYNSTRTKLYCSLCTPGLARAYFLFANRRPHLKTATHRDAEKRAEEAKAEKAARQRRRETERENQRRVEPASLADARLRPEISGQPPPSAETYNLAPDAFWDDANYDLGPDLNAASAEEDARLRRDMESAELWCDERFGNVVGSEEADDAEEQKQWFIEEQEERMLNDMLENAAVDDHTLNNILYGSSTSPTDGKYWPYDSQASDLIAIQMCILDILDNIPRVPVSTSLMKLIIWALRELGVPNVPSFYSLRKTQEQLRQSQGVSNIECKSVQGTVFYINDIRKIIAQDWLNPLVRPYINVYPVVPDNGCISEVWHAAKWHKTLDIDLLSPMYDAGTKHYYIHELARQDSGDLVIPIRWVIQKGEICADAYTVSINEQGKADVQHAHPIRITAKTLQLNFLDLEHQKMTPSWTDSSMTAGFPSKMPNKYRAIADGDPLYVSFIDYFGDDVSGNRSKSWNKHNNSYVTHRNLPQKLLQQEYHVHLVSTSQHASIAEQYHAVKKLIDSTRQDPIKVADPSGLTTRFMIQPHSGPGDNPAQSDVASHIGSGGNHPCRKCEMGGPEVERAKGEGFHAVFKPGTPRTQAKIRAELEEQVTLACNGESAVIKTRQTNSGTKDAYTQYWIEDLVRRFHELRNEQTDDEARTALLAWAREHTSEIYNSFLTTDGFDPARDTPVEILHTILLGVVKYIWHYSSKKWTSSQKITYSQRLQATDTDGLSIAEIQAEYIMNYSNSLNGRQFRQVVQTAVFHVHDLVDDDHFVAWKAVGHLAALLWQPEIDDVAQYCRDVDVAAANVQDAFAIIDPTKMLRKFKLHLLGHLIEDIEEFGPLVGVATETFESYNSVFRSCSILSNHRAPSRDITRQIGSQESLKHRLSGGSWYNTETEEWTQAGDGVRGVLRKHKVLQTMLGWSTQKEVCPGSSTPIPVGRRPKEISEDVWAMRRQLKLQDTHAKNATNAASYAHEMPSTWIRCCSVTASSREACSVGSWVIYSSPITSTPAVGRIVEILSKDGIAIVVVEEFSVAPERDLFFDLPYIYRRQDEASFIIIPATFILLSESTIQAEYAARLSVLWLYGIRNTENDARYLINLFSFHNAHLIRRVLPRALTAPIPLLEDRLSKHVEIAEELHVTLVEKKAETQRKRAETVLKKRKAAEEAVNNTDDHIPKRCKR
ncbi:hypothetical protein V5O48_016988 [Marasmius crinis-equi]|uniref:Uncharacterized protein n=1 Tax=Marasmius crinis-equi TaxID=585013 RepID=A0ABR3EQ78_9AGAR